MVLASTWSAPTSKLRARHPRHAGSGWSSCSANRRCRAICEIPSRSEFVTSIATAFSRASAASIRLYALASDCSAIAHLRSADLLELLGKLRHDLEQVADQADVGDLEDGRFLILVDGDDRLAILHAGEMLDRA